MSFSEMKSNKDKLTVSTEEVVIQDVRQVTFSEDLFWSRAPGTAGGQLYTAGYVEAAEGHLYTDGYAEDAGGNLYTAGDVEAEEGHLYTQLDMWRLQEVI